MRWQSRTSIRAIQNVLDLGFRHSSLVLAARNGEQLAAVMVHDVVVHDDGSARGFLNFIDDLSAVTNDHADAASRNPHFQRGGKQSASIALHLEVLQ